MAAAKHTPVLLVCWRLDGTLKLVDNPTSEEQMLAVLVEVERCSDALLFRPDLVANIRAAIVRAAGPDWRAAIAKATGAAS
jgi:hypothetical protein